MVDENGIPKGMKAVLHERGVNTVALKAKEMRDLLKSFLDFQNQSTVLETYIQERGHICVEISLRAESNRARVVPVKEAYPGIC